MAVTDTIIAETVAAITIPLALTVVGLMAIMAGMGGEDTVGVQVEGGMEAEDALEDQEDVEVDGVDEVDGRCGCLS